MLREIAYAKVNLALHVRARRADGYHRIESLFAFAEDGDVLEVEAANGLSLSIDGPFAGGLDTGSGNLVMRAAMALRDAAHVERGAAIRLIKNLPLASGIGGGSADAAAALRLLSRLWDVALSSEALHAIALSLGSDVPACLPSRTQFVGGRGEELDMRTIPGLAGMAMLLVNPGVAVPTGPIFAGWDRIDRGALNADSLSRIVGEGRNDLAASAIALAPDIVCVLDALAIQPGVRLARMSGSGATCLALFAEETAMAAASTALKKTNPHWWTMQTRIRSA